MWMKYLPRLPRTFDLPNVSGYVRNLFSLIIILFGIQTSAQELGFADGFSHNSFSYVTFSTTSAGTASIIGEPGAIRMSAQQNGTEQSDRWLSTSLPSNSLIVTAAFDAATDLASGTGAIGAVNVSGTLFNDTKQNLDGNLMGDVVAFIDMQARDDGMINIFACVGRNGDSGFESVNVFPNGGNCTFFENDTLQPGVFHTLGYRFEPDSSLLTFIFNDIERTVTLNLPMFETVNRAPQLNVYQRGGPGSVVANISSITTDVGTDDFTGITPTVDRYQRLFRLDGTRRDARIDNGRLRFELNSIDDRFEDLILRPLQAQFYIEALVTIDGESDVSSGGIATEIEARYNDTADSGFDGETGDVVAELQLRRRADGTREAQYCLFRSNNPDFSEASGLLDDENRFCNSFPLLINDDQTYRASVEIDPSSSVVRFRVDGLETEVPITTGVYQASTPGTLVRALATESATAVVFFDDIRTTPDSLTQTEQQSNLSTPPPFPDPPDPQSLEIDTSISDPFDFRQPLSFIDNFAAPTTQFSVWVSRDRGESSIQVNEGALELQSNTASGERDSWTELRVNDNTDSMKARVSLRSSTALPASNRVEATMRVRAVFHNDTQDGGFNDREGDVRVSIRLRIAGNGRRTADFKLDRRDAEGNTQPLNIVDGSNRGRFDDLIPELDTIYALKMEIDRARSVLVLSIDDHVQEIPLPTPAYLPAAREALIQVDQYGSPGRAVGRLHSIETDNISHDFSSGLPFLAPYRPFFSARYPGRFVATENGRVRLETDSSLLDNQHPNLTGLGSSDFVSAELELSSNSTITDDGRILGRVGGSMYQEIEFSNESENVVFAAVNLVANGSGERYAEYCAFRSITPDFSETVQIVGADSGSCPRFTGTVELDTPYPVSVQLDRDASMLKFSFGNEVTTHAISTPIFDIDRPFVGAGARAADGSKAVVYVDDLAFAQQPTPISDTEEIPIKDNGNDEEPPSNPIENPMDITTFDLFGIVYSSSAIELRWAGLSGNVSVTRNGESVYSGDGRSFYDDTLLPATAYTYTVSNGNAPSASILLITWPDYPIAEKQPAAPSDFRGIAYSSTAGETFWSRVNSTPPARWYELSVDGWVVGTFDALSFFTDNLNPATTYTYDIISISEDGQRSNRQTVFLTTNQ